MEYIFAERKFFKGLVKKFSTYFCEKYTQNDYEPLHKFSSSDQRLES